MEKVQQLSRSGADAAADRSRGWALAASGVTVGVTALLTLLGAGVLQYVDGDDLGSALFASGPRLIWSTLWFVAPVWIALVAAANLRWRRLAAERLFAATVVTALACAGVATLGWFFVALVEGGWALLLVAISLVTASLFALSATVAAALTHLWWFRGRGRGAGT
jgi:hypothetical protein